MPAYTQIGGVDYWLTPLLAVRDENGESPEGATITITSREAATLGEVLTPLDPVTQDPVVPYATKVDGLAFPVLVPRLELTYDAGYLPFPVTAEGAGELALDATAARIAAEAAQAAAVAAQAAAEASAAAAQLLADELASLVARVNALEQAGPYVEAVPGYEPVGYGVVTTSAPPAEADLVVGQVFDVID